MNTDNKNLIKSSIKIFDVLELIVEKNKTTVTEASQETGYTKSTIQRILNTLKYLDYIEQNENTLEYYPTFKLHTLSNHLLINNTIQNTSRHHMTLMSKEINETINLGTLENYNVIYLDKILSRYPLRVDIGSTNNIPLYSSALGKTMAAFSKEKFSFGKNYQAFTKHTIKSDKELSRELETVRKNGYALDNEEFLEGLICIGAPILNQENIAIASLSISIPAIRFQEENLDKYVDLLKKYTGDIQKDLFKNRKAK